eukprot:TRINITY_DN11367_c0_g1_i1.p1 TRINITY_DN11367_c0_g1~~TRINITY_DN11367_c0_g1_i1.p1  ORF type:complete len:274 (-),score=43.21 TRINITY_DN11367_c0_g1_i1:176-997(-)
MNSSTYRGTTKKRGSTQPPENTVVRGFTAFWKRGFVIVEDRNDMRDLYLLGCFGKGSCSRSRPFIACGSSKDMHESDLERISKRRQKAEASSIAAGQLAKSNSEDSSLDQERDQLAEVLILMPEESLFLMHNLCCLRIFDGDHCLSVEELWTRLVHQNSLLPYSYVSYFHLRIKGWNVRSGLKFGCDFAAYEKDPEICHAEFSVCVVPAKEVETISWLSAMSSVRVQEKVNKRMVYHVVSFGESFTSSPSSALSTATVQEIELRRCKSLDEDV